jgi:SNF2 family DNA or RNA helicase
MHQWMNEIDKSAANLRAICIDGRQYSQNFHQKVQRELRDQILASDVVVTTYNTISPPAKSRVGGAAGEEVINLNK